MLLKIIFELQFHFDYFWSILTKQLQISTYYCEFVKIVIYCLPNNIPMVILV